MLDIRNGWLTTVYCVNIIVHSTVPFWCAQWHFLFLLVARWTMNICYTKLVPTNDLWSVWKNWWELPWTQPPTYSVNHHQEDRWSQSKLKKIQELLFLSTSVEDVSHGESALGGQLHWWVQVSVCEKWNFFSHLNDSYTSTRSTYCTILCNELFQSIHCTIQYQHSPNLQNKSFCTTKFSGFFYFSNTPTQSWLSFFFFLQ